MLGKIIQSLPRRPSICNTDERCPLLISKFITTYIRKAMRDRDRLKEKFHTSTIIAIFLFFFIISFRFFSMPFFSFFSLLFSFIYFLGIFSSFLNFTLQGSPGDEIYFLPLRQVTVTISVFYNLDALNIKERRFASPPTLKQNFSSNVFLVLVLSTELMM